MLLLCLCLPLLLYIACSKSSTTKDNISKKKNGDTLSNSELSKYDLKSESPAIIQLPKQLKEISGMTITPNGRLFAHQDESGVIFEVNLQNGEIIKKFSLGYIPIKGDFEDIAFVNNKFYLVNSNGDIFEFEEGEDNKSVEYKVYKTGLKSSQDVEGLSYDPETNSLLLACKGSSGIENDNSKAVYSFSLDKKAIEENPRFLIPLSEIKNTFAPSGIQKNLNTGTFFIIAASGNEIIEISKDGKILGKSDLPAKANIQPEGIIFANDNTLYISNEGKGGNGYIVIYQYKK